MVVEYDRTHHWPWFHWSTFTYFAYAIAYQKFNERVIARWFNKLVEKDDWKENPRNEVYDFLRALTNAPRRVFKWGKTPLEKALGW